MNKSIPTLLGLAIILLVVILVLSIYTMTIMSKMAQGEKVVGTVATKALAGGQAPAAEPSASEALAEQMTKKKVVSPIEVQQKQKKISQTTERQTRREEEMKDTYRGEAHGRQDQPKTDSEGE